MAAEPSGQARAVVRLVTGSGALLGAAGLQMLFFLASAKLLKPTEFGYLSAIWAYCLPASEVIGMGAGDYLVQRVSRQPRLFPLLYGSALKAIAWTVPLIVPLIALLWFILGQAVTAAAIAMLVASEGVLARVITLSEQIMIGHGQASFANAQRLFVAGVRLAGLALFYALGFVATIERFAVFYVLAATFSTAVVMLVTTRLYGMPRRGLATIARPSFLLHNLGRSVAGTLDRMTLSLVLPFAQLGVYSAGTRVLQIGTIPILALFRDTYPGFFRAGRQGVAAALAYGLSLTRRTIAISLVSMLAAGGFALLMPALLGHRYAGSTVVGLIVSLSTLPIALQYAAGDVLTGSNRQRLRAQVTIGGLILAVPTMIGGALLYGPVGAALANLLGQLIAAAALALVVRAELGRERAA